MRRSPQARRSHPPLKRMRLADAVERGEKQSLKPQVMGVCKGVGDKGFPPAQALTRRRKLSAISEGGERVERMSCPDDVESALGAVQAPVVSFRTRLMAQTAAQAPRALR